MNLQVPCGNDLPSARSHSRPVAISPQRCARNLDRCTGTCEIFQSSLRGREVIDRGLVAEAAGERSPADYSHLCILGSARESDAGQGCGDASDLAALVDTSSVFGQKHPVRSRLPILSGAISAVDVDQRLWPGLVIGAAISGIAIVVGQDIASADPELELDQNGRVLRSPELERLIQAYRQWQQGDGEVIVQLASEDLRRGMAEYAVGKLGVESVELTWGEGPRGRGTTLVHSLELAIELSRQGATITPNPEDPAIQAAFRAGAIPGFERHRAPRFINAESFLQSVQRLRDEVGVKRVAVKLSVCQPREMATALRWSSDAQVDLVTIERTVGVGLSTSWGIPTFYLECMAWKLAAKLATQSRWIPQLAMGGRFSTEEELFKILALGAPWFRAVAMGPALATAALAGSVVEGAIRSGSGFPWKSLPPAVQLYGQRPEEIFVTYEALADRLGKEAMERLPLSAVAIYTYADRLRAGLTRLLVGTGNRRIDSLARKELVALSPEATRISGIPYVLDAAMDEAQRILDAP